MRFRLIALIFLILMPSGMFAQKGTMISVREENVPIKDVLKIIQKESDFSLFYNSELASLNNKVSIQVKKASINEVLDQILAGTDLIYKILENKFIVISTKEGFEKHIVSGMVISSETGESIPGVNVYIKGSTTGTITDIDGKFKLEVPGGESILVFSFIGYSTNEIPAGDSKEMNIVLQESINALDEVVVTALGITRRAKTVGYAITEVGGDEVNKVKDKNVMNSLSGKVAGLQVSRTASGVGGSSRITIRGVSSMLGNNKPLFVIDGVPMDVSNMGDGGQWGGRDMGDGISDINPEDVESISVLKGPSAAAAYGSRGANGVVLITTKGGKGSKRLGITFSSGYTNESPLVFPNLQNEYGLGAYGVYPPINQEGIPSPEYPWTWSFGPKLDGTPRINWLGVEQPYTAQPNNYSDYFRNGTSLSNSIALEGGSETASSRFSFTDFRSKGLVPNNDLNRQTINFRGITKIDKFAEVDARVTYIRQVVNNRPVLSENSHNPVTSLEYLPRNLRMEDLENNTVDENGKEMDWLSDIFSSNPYWVLENIGTKDEKHRIMSSISLKLNFTDWLSLQARLGLDFYTMKSKDWRGNGSKLNSAGSLSVMQRNNTEMNSDLLLSANKKISELFTISANIGANMRYNHYEDIRGHGSRFSLDGFYHLSNTNGTWASEYYSDKAVYSAYLLGNIGFKDYLFLDFSLRNDWSSTLPAGNNSYFYHSEGFSFIFSDAFQLKNNWFEFGKLRFGFAVVGNDTSPYVTQQYYSISGNYVYPTASISNELPFSDLKPETTKGFEVGTNLVFLKGGINLDVTYFQGYSIDQIMSVPLSGFSAYTSKKFNAGTLKGNGVEISLNVTPINPASGFTWNFIINYSRSRNIVYDIHSDLEKIILGTLWSASIQAVKGDEFGVIYGNGYKRDDQGRKLIDKFGYAQTDGVVKLGSINPDFLGGFHNSFGWKGFDFSFLIDIQVGGEFFSWGKAIRSLFGTTVETLEGRAEWYATHQGPTNGETIPGVVPRGYIEDGVLEGSDGEPNDIPIQPIRKWYNVYSKDIAEEWIIDATNIRMREMLLGYTFSKQILAKTPIKNLNIALTGRNLFFLYRASRDADPESGFNSGNIGTGFENHALPTTRSLGVSLRFEF